MSIGVPVRGGGRFLRRRLENLLALRYPRLEIAVSDDASSDDSLAIAEEFARRDARIRVFARRTPLGVGGNFGWLMEQARGDFFFLAAQDDLHHPDFVMRCVATLEEQPDLWGVSVAWRYMDDEDQPVDWPDKDSLLLDTRGKTLGEKLAFFMAGASGGYLYSFWRLAPFRRREVSMTRWGSHPFYEYPWILGVLLRGDIGRVSDVLFTYRLHLQGGPAPAPHPDSTGLTIPADRWQAMSDAEKARRFFRRYGEVIEEWASGDHGKVRHARWALLWGAWRSHGGSQDWYQRCKAGRSTARRAAWRERRGWEWVLLLGFLVLRCKPLRWLLRRQFDLE